MERGSQRKKEMSKGRTRYKISRDKTKQAVPAPIILHYFEKTFDNRKFTLGDK